MERTGNPFPFKISIKTSYQQQREQDDYQNLVESLKGLLAEAEASNRQGAEWAKKFDAEEKIKKEARLRRDAAYKERMAYFEKRKAEQMKVLAAAEKRSAESFKRMIDSEKDLA